VTPARTIALALAALCLGAPGCSRLSDSVTYQGSVVNETIRVAAPALPTPSPATEVGLGEQPQQTPGSLKARATTIATVTGLGSVVRIAEAKAEQGDSVRAGEVLARFDDAVLSAQVKAAQADVAYGKARSKSLRSRRDDVKSAQSTIAENRAQLASTVAQLRSTRARLVRQLASARAALAQLAAAKSQIESVLEQLPPAGAPPGGPPPGGAAPTSTPPGGPPDPSALRAQLAQINSQMARVRSGIGQLRAGIARIDSGLARARSGQSQLESAQSSSASARATLADAIELSDLGLAASRVALMVARQHKDFATVKSPVDGVVVETSYAGDVMAPGATAFVIRPDTVARMRTWLSVEQASEVALGTAADVSADWAGEAVPGTVTLIGSKAQFPPTTLSTDVIHLIRAVPVEVTLETSSAFPAGTPVDLSFERK